jgi:hypothetical protein
MQFLLQFSSLVCLPLTLDPDILNAANWHACLKR